MLCSECKKNAAILFYNKVENGKETMEGLCYDCAKKKGINPLDVLSKQSDLLNKDKINLNDMSKQLETVFKDLAENINLEDIENMDDDDDNLLVSDKIMEDTSELLLTSDKKEYVKKADEYRDMKYSGITFIVFGIIGLIYLALCKLEVLPITYNNVIFVIIVILFVIFVISGIVSIHKAGKIKLLISEEEAKTKEIKEWLDQNLTQDMIDGWLDSQVTDMENDLILTARIKKMLEKEFDDQSEEYIEMIADEYFEEHFMEEDE